MLTDEQVISGIIKWCWSRLEGGVVGWDAYELFKAGEMGKQPSNTRRRGLAHLKPPGYLDSNWARDSFQTFIPLAVDNECRSKIIFDFFDLLAAVAAHSKVNGFGGRKLSRMAAWWAFQQGDTGSGFHGGYKAWLMYAKFKRNAVGAESTNSWTGPPMPRATFSSHISEVYLFPLISVVSLCCLCLCKNSSRKPSILR